MNNHEETQSKLNNTHPYKKLITIYSAIVAISGGVTAAAYFIGYSFLKGRIAGHGLGEHELELSAHESVMQAAFATKAMFDEFSVSVASFFHMGLLELLITAIAIGLMLKIILFTPSKSKTLIRFGQFFSKLPKIAKEVVIYPTIGLLGMIFIMTFILTLLNFLWTNLSIAHDTGIRVGRQDVSKLLCVALEKSDKKEGLIPSCSIFYDIEKVLYVGKILHSNKQMTLLQTNTESVLFDKNRNVVACSAILNTALKSKEQVKNKCLVDET
jgi:hypothetical protein